MAFTTRTVIRALIKYIYSFNHYGTKDVKINNIKAVAEYPRYSQIKDWRYIVQCEKIEEFKNTFIINIHKELKQYQYKEIINQELRIIVNDIRQYVNKEDEECNTN